MIKIILDNGHGVNTPGKRSVDSRLLEYSYTREIVKGIKNKLDELEIDSFVLVPEEEDISLQERCRRANKYYTENGCDSVLISCHVNANGMGDSWNSANGWEAYTYYGTSKSDELAEYLYKAAEKYLPGKKLRKDPSDGDSDKEAGFYILKHTIMPAVLTENLFMTNKDEVDFLLFEEGKKAVINLHVDGIINYIKSQE